MRKMILGSASAVLLTLTGFAAHASCSDPRAPSQTAMPQIAPMKLYQGPTEAHGASDEAKEKIVGTWHVLYTADGALVPYAQAFIQWHSDRTEWENITMPVLGGNICMGSWKTVDRWHVFRNHVGWLFNNGTISGYFNETETVEVSNDGNLYQGSNETIGYDMTGTQIFDVKGTAAATRIAP